MKLKSRVNDFASSEKEWIISDFSLYTPFLYFWEGKAHRMENLCGERKLFHRHKWLLCLSASKESLCLCIILCACVCKCVASRGEPQSAGWGMRGGCAFKSAGSWQELAKVQKGEGDWCRRLKGAEKSERKLYRKWEQNREVDYMDKDGDINIIEM